MNWFQRGIQFTKEAYAELTKVTWLGKKEVVASTVVVLILIGLMALYVFVIDQALAFLLRIALL